MHDLKMFVAMHKAYNVPRIDGYVAIEVGAACRNINLDNCVRDDSGENISAKNPNYCELTAMYWAWKNATDTDYIGLCHYRRYFGKGKSPATKAQVLSRLEAVPVLLPTKRNYFIETNYSQYIHAHNELDLTLTRQIISERCPQYLLAWDRVMESTKGHRFNMFVMRRDIFNDYCAWLFDILFELEARLDISTYSTNDKRVFGFVAERLLDIWIDKNEISYAEMPVYNVEPINWINKGLSFLRRKFVVKSNK